MSIDYFNGLPDRYTLLKQQICSITFNYNIIKGNLNSFEDIDHVNDFSQ